MKTPIIHRSDTRGFADHGWLQTRHTFSFADYFDPERIHFGALRVLNDDVIAGHSGFGMHPHDNMEIITIPLEGSLEHKDNMGHTSQINAGEVQVMSAGTGLFHSEYNALPDNDLKLLQIWVYPDSKGVKPRYDQIRFDPKGRKDQWQQIVSPDPQEAGIWIHQRAWFHLGNLSAGTTLGYSLKHPENILYVFVISGDVQVEDQILHERDGMGIFPAGPVSFNALTFAEVLLMEVPDLHMH